MKIPTPILPVRYSRKYAHELIEKYFVGPDAILRNIDIHGDFIETEGDSEELTKMINTHNHFVYHNSIPLENTDLVRFLTVAESLDLFWHYETMSHEEAMELPGCFRYIRENYPALYQTALVWAWG